MKRLVLAIVLVAVVAAVGAGGAFYYIRHIGTNSTCSDPGSISSHVYNPGRLTIVTSCITASGIDENVFEEADGDYHVRLALDDQYANLTNSANDQYQYGGLVVEIICALG